MYVTKAKCISFNTRILKNIIISFYELVIQGSRLNKQAKLSHLFSVFTHSTSISILQKGIKVILGIDTQRILISPKCFSHVIVFNPKQKLGLVGICQMSQDQINPGEIKAIIPIRFSFSTFKNVELGKKIIQQFCFN